MTVAAALRAGPGLAHSAVVTGSDADLTAVLGPELRRSAAEYDEILLVVGPRTRRLLHERIDDLDGLVRWGDPAAFYQRLGFAYEGFRRYLDEQKAAGRRVHVIAEPDLTGGVDAGLRADRAAAYLAYEAVCNDTYAPYEATVTCIWNRQHHPAAVLDGVSATHRYVLGPAGRTPSASYLEPERYLAAHHDLPWPPAPAEAEREVLLAGVADLSRLRAVMHDWAAAHRFAEEPADDLVVAAVEVATNGLRHGAPPVRVRAWRHGGTLIVQCDDAAGRPIGAQAGYRRPERTAATPGGRGLWLVRQLADVVITRCEPGRTSVRLHFPYEVLHRPQGEATRTSQPRQ